MGLLPAIRILNKQGLKAKTKLAPIKIYKYPNMWSSMILLKPLEQAHGSTPEKEFSDESSCDKWENILPTNRNDHSYLCNQKYETEPPSVKTIDEQAIQIEKSKETNDRVLLQTISAFKENITPDISQTLNVSEQNTPLPVKKKRGRKPGSKQKNITKHCFNSGQQTYYSPTLKNPAKYPDLIHFKDDDDKIYLRHTSRDVMLSSTLPFQETPEYLELKEMYFRLCNQRKMN